MILVVITYYKSEYFESSKGVVFQSWCLGNKLFLNDGFPFLGGLRRWFFNLRWWRGRRPRYCVVSYKLEDLPRGKSKELLFLELDHRIKIIFGHSNVVESTAA